MMDRYDLYDTASGALLREAVPHATPPVDPAGKGWAWQPHDKPDATTTADPAWDPETRTHVLVDAEDAVGRLDALRDRLIAGIKLGAYETIVAYVPEWQQRNLTARGVQLLRRITADTATTEEIAEADAIEAIWEHVAAIRAASDAAEAAVIAARGEDDPEAMQAAAVVEWPAAPE